jgi:signal transduction histidine kinase
LRRRILGSTVAVTAAALITFGVPFGWALERIYRSQQLSRLSSTATIAGAAVPPEGLHGADPVEPPPVKAGVHLTYYDNSGAVVVGGGSAHIDLQVRRALGGHPAQGSSSGRLVVAVPITSNEATIGAVEASSPSSAVASRVAKSWLAMALLGLVALALAAVIAERQARRLARPVEDLVAAADLLGEGEFAVRVPVSNVAELDRAGAALASTSARLGELMDRERAFTAHASHQLRTPLTALRMSLENATLTPGVALGDALRDAIGEVDRLQDTVEQLFTLARGGTSFGRQVSLGRTVAEVDHRWHAVLADRGRRLHVVVDERTKSRLVPATLGQILDILLDNATNHGRGTVEISAHDVGGGLSIDVSDEGDGVGTLRDDFSVSGMIADDGHGLGLPLARSLADAAGGRLVLKRAGPRPVIGVILP